MQRMVTISLFCKNVPNPADAVSWACVDFRLVARCTAQAHHPSWTGGWQTLLARCVLYLYQKQKVLQPNLKAYSPPNNPQPCTCDGRMSNPRWIRVCVRQKGLWMDLCLHREPLRFLARHRVRMRLQWKSLSRADVANWVYRWTMAFCGWMGCSVWKQHNTRFWILYCSVYKNVLWFWIPCCLIVA